MTSFGFSGRDLGLLKARERARRPTKPRATDPSGVQTVDAESLVKPKLRDPPATPSGEGPAESKRDLRGLEDALQLRGAPKGPKQARTDAGIFLHYDIRDIVAREMADYRNSVIAVTAAASTVQCAELVMTSDFWFTHLAVHVDAIANLSRAGLEFEYLSGNATTIFVWDQGADFRPPSCLDSGAQSFLNNGVRDVSFPFMIPEGGRLRFATNSNAGGTQTTTFRFSRIGIPAGAGIPGG